MLTKSIIAAKTEIGYQLIYCHFQGYDNFEGIGPTLSKFHTTQEAVERLLKTGNIAELIEGQAVIHNKAKWGKCLQIVSTFEEVRTVSKNHGAEYLYLFIDGKWVTYYS